MVCCYAGSQRRERGRPLNAASSALQIPSVQPLPGYAVPSQPPPVPDTERASSDDSVFTPADWANVLKGYRSQYVEHDYWVPANMIEGMRLSAAASYGCLHPACAAELYCMLPLCVPTRTC